jgi:hypothetical protein
MYSARALYVTKDFAADVLLLLSFANETAVVFWGFAIARCVSFSCCC